MFFGSPDQVAVDHRICNAPTVEVGADPGRQIRVVGLRKAEEIASKMAYLELSVEPGYMDEYMAALFFPHTDLKRFPSLKI